MGSSAGTSNYARANARAYICTLKTSYRNDFDEYIYQDIREYLTIELLMFNCNNKKELKSSKMRFNAKDHVF